MPVRVREAYEGIRHGKREGESAVKRLLVIAFDFPPRRTSGVYRITGLAKYLLRYGWEPTVVTIQGIAGDCEDPLLLERIPSQVEVVRTPYLRIAGWEDVAAKSVMKLGALQSRPKNLQPSRVDRALRSLGALLRSCLYFPDETVGWVPFGLAAAARLHVEKRFDAMYTTSPPRSAPVIGLFLRTSFRVPWVAEFRDPWYPPRRPLRRCFERWLQLHLLRNADAVVAHSKGFGEELIRSYRVPPKKLAVISNGFDEDDFSSENGHSCEPLTRGYFHLSHFGTVYPNRSGKFFPALAELLRECPRLKQRLRVNIIGFPDREVEHYARSDELREVIQIHSFMSHDDSIRAMRSSHSLLVFWADPYCSRLTVAGKLYEYLRAGRPILALDWGGETKELVERGGAGSVVCPDDVEGIKRALRKMLSEDANQNPPRPARPEFVAQFRYDRLAARLAGVLDEISGNNH